MWRNRKRSYKKLPKKSYNIIRTWNESSNFFNQILNKLNIDFPTYINSLNFSLKKPIIFFLKNVKDVWTNVFGIKASPFWGANIDVQFILDLYVIANYFTSYDTKVDKIITKEFWTIIDYCQHENTNSISRIKKLGNAFLNAQ
jgi:hypothetical protein